MNWNVYNPAGRKVAALLFAEDAAALVALYGDGATIRTRPDRVLWTEGGEDQPAGESYDHARDVVHERHATKAWTAPGALPVVPVVDHHAVQALIDSTAVSHIIRRDQVRVGDVVVDNDGPFFRVDDIDDPRVRTRDQGCFGAQPGNLVFIGHMVRNPKQRMTMEGARDAAVTIQREAPNGREHAACAFCEEPVIKGAPDAERRVCDNRPSHYRCRRLAHETSTDARGLQHQAWR